MSKTFKSALGPSDSRRVHVESHPAGPNVWISDTSWGDDYGITLAPSDIPALMLALAEAAGYKEEQGNETTEAAHHFGMSMLHLRFGIKEQEYITAEAESQAKLEAEARDFYDTYHSAADWPYQDWAMLEDRYKAQFLAVARRAREINKEENNA